MTFPIIAAATAGVLLMLQQILMLSVGFTRTALSVGVGHGDNADLERVMRRHANLAENAAIFVVTLALLEFLVGQGFLVGISAAIFIAGRFAHAVAFTSRTGSHDVKEASAFLALRAMGAFATAFTGLATGGILVYQLAISTM